MSKRSIESYVRAQAVVLYQSGLNLSKISKQLQVSRCCIRNAITQFDDMKRSGRPKSLSDCNIHELKRLVQGDNRLSAAKITTDLNISLFKPVSKRTVRQKNMQSRLKKAMAEYEASKSSRNDINIGLSKIGERKFLATNQPFTF